MDRTKIKPWCEIENITNSERYLVTKFDKENWLVYAINKEFKFVTIDLSQRQAKDYKLNTEYEIKDIVQKVEYKKIIKFIKSEIRHAEELERRNRMQKKCPWYYINPYKLRRREMKFLRTIDLQNFINESTYIEDLKDKIVEKYGKEFHEVFPDSPRLLTRTPIAYFKYFIEKRYKVDLKCKDEEKTNDQTIQTI